MDQILRKKLFNCCPTNTDNNFAKAQRSKFCAKSDLIAAHPDNGGCRSGHGDEREVVPALIRVHAGEVIYILHTLYVISIVMYNAHNIYRTLVCRVR